MGAELDWERVTLVRAGVHIVEGEERLGRQITAIAEARGHGHPTVDAERLFEVMSGILSEWQRHRDLIAMRIAVLEARERDRPRADPAHW